MSGEGTVENVPFCLEHSQVLKMKNYHKKKNGMQFSLGMKAW